MISGGKLGNHCRGCPRFGSGTAVILDFRPRLENHGKDCRWQRRMVSPAAAVAATMSASDSIFRCREGEWPACSSRSGNELPRPILFFVAAKENGSACSGSRQRPSASDSNLRCRKKEWPACSSRCGNDLPRPILISVATKENGSA